MSVCSGGRVYGMMVGLPGISYLVYVFPFEYAKEVFPAQIRNQF